MHILILAVGRQREEGFRISSEEYLRRLTRYCRIQIAEVEDEKDPGAAQETLADLARAREAARILGRIRPQDHVVALDAAGESLDSLGFSERMRQWQAGSAPLVFVIGGSLGLDGAVTRRADERLSLSSLTFPHQLARVVLLEQIYRSFKIIAGERYHK